MPPRRQPVGLSSVSPMMAANVAGATSLDLSPKCCMNAHKSGMVLTHGDQQLALNVYAYMRQLDPETTLDKIRLAGCGDKHRQMFDHQCKDRIKRELQYCVNAIQEAPPG